MNNIIPICNMINLQPREFKARVTNQLIARLFRRDRNEVVYYAGPRNLHVSITVGISEEANESHQLTKIYQSKKNIKNK